MTDYKGYTFEYHHKFKKEFKKIFTKKHCPTIKSDFQLLYDILIKHLEESDKFRCQGINKGSRSGFRITFLFDKKEKKFIFLEFFQKSKKDIPNKDRINELFKKNVKIHGELYKNEEEYLNRILFNYGILENYFYYKD